jgi:hypothetical protein
MEIVEMYCDLLLARFGLVTQLKELDDGISEAVASIIWVAPRLQADVQELKGNYVNQMTFKIFYFNCSLYISYYGFVYAEVR